MRPCRAVALVLSLATIGASLSRSGQAETPDAVTSADAGEQPDASTPPEPDGGTAEPIIVPSAPAMPGMPPAAVALPKPFAPPSHPQPAQDLKLPDDAPPVTDNELALEVGWNSDAPFGLRYLRKIEATDISFGAGVGALTVWGPKISGIIRVQPSFALGIFAQVSAGFAEGGTFTQTITPPSGPPLTAHLVRTPARTIDLLAGWRWPWSAYYIEGAAGYSFNLAGTVLQNAAQSNVPIDTGKIPYSMAGGPAGDIALGWFF